MLTWILDSKHPRTKQFPKAGSAYGPHTTRPAPSARSGRAVRLGHAKAGYAALRLPARTTSMRDSPACLRHAIDSA